MISVVRSAYPFFKFWGWHDRVKIVICESFVVMVLRKLRRHEYGRTFSNLTQPSACMSDLQRLRRDAHLMIKEKTIVRIVTLAFLDHVFEAGAIIPHSTCYSSDGSLQLASARAVKKLLTKNRARRWTRGACTSVIA